MRYPGLSSFWTVAIPACLVLLSATCALAEATTPGDHSQNMQYFKPDGIYFVGDCMPFFQDGVFHFYYLLDENHHHGKNGLGGHQWAHASTSDLRHWKHHPLAIAITEEREASICTGSVFYHDGLYRGYYATRMMDGTEHLSVATSTDGIHFEKTQPNPFASPGEGYAPRAYRDPFVFQDERTGLFHLLAAASRTDYPVQDRGGCLAQLISKDLKHWELTEPFVIPGYHGVPECPDYFSWNGWFYLVFSLDGVAQYRLSREPLGPWTRPAVDTLDGPMARVMKTAPFTGGRRIGAAFLPTLDGNKDNGGWQYAGNAVFREIIQQPDGCLGSKFPEEMTPEGGTPQDLPFTPLTKTASGTGQHVEIRSPEGFGVGYLSPCPVDARISFRVTPESGAADVGVCLRGTGEYAEGYEIRFSPQEQRVTLRSPQSRIFEDHANHALTQVTGLDKSFTVDLVLKDDIIDLCVDQRRCMVTRCTELRGDRLFFFAHNASATFDAITVRPL